MINDLGVQPDRLLRRSVLRLGVAGLLGATIGRVVRAQSDAAKQTPSPQSSPTKFQMACMTLPYSQYPLERALSGLKSAGYKHVAWEIGRAHV